NSGGRLSLGLRDLLERAAEMDGARFGARRGGPRHRSVERVIELEDAGAATEARERATIALGKSRTCDARELPGRGVEEHGPRGRQVFESRHWCAGLDLPA